MPGCMQVKIRSLHGTGQKTDSFWNAIVRHFIKLLPAGELSAPEHSMSSMQARWALVNKDATKFCTLMDQVHSMPWSGWTDDMYMDKALNSSSRKRGKATDGTEFCQLSAIFFTSQGTYTRYWLTLYMANFYRVRLWAPCTASIQGTFWHTQWRCSYQSELQ